MSRKIQVNRLLQDELSYELQIRGIATGTVEEMRHSLAMALRFEKSGDSFSYPNYPFTCKQDIEAVTDKLDILESQVNDFDGSSSSLYSKLQSRLSHVLNRLDHVDANGPEAGKRGELLAKALSILDKIEKKAPATEPEPTAASPNLTNPSPIRRSSGVHDVPIPGPYSKQILPNKWGLKFSGDRKGISLSAFLERVEELRVARHVSKQTLLESGIDLFEGRAYQFYVAYRDEVGSWDEFVTLLREEYLSPNYDEKLLEEIKKRTQGSDESIGIYLAVMMGYFNRLINPVSEERKLQLIMRNIAPFYQSQLALVDVRSLSHLRELCRRLEARKEAVENFVAPSRKFCSLEPDLAYVEVENLEVSAVSSQPSNSKGSMVCYRCHQPGHRAIGCTLPKSKFCYRCKKDGYTVRTCPDCSKQGNEQQRQYASKPNLASFNTMSSRRSRNTRSKTKRQSSFHKVYEYDCGSNYCGCSNNMNGISHPETLSVSLTSERGIGYGLAVNVGDHVENRTADILIARIVPDSPAYRCGCLQVGDRLISVNHQPNLTLQEINSILELGNDQIGGKVTLQIEFDVADTVVPSSGVFTVKLSKRGVNLGITITALKNRPDEPFIISEIRRGSVAHRTGTLHAGDRLLAIDNRPLDNLLLDAALDILQSFSNDIITLKIEKTETENSNLFLDSVVYTVELHRYGGPLGITISGSEDCVDPIVLSRLTEGGLAEKTGALHVGDRILAINGDSLEHKPLSEAIRLLQSSGDRVQLKIARNIKPDLLDENRCNYSSPGLMSMDSAIHSWDSNTVDNVNDNITDIAEIKDAESVLSEPISYEEHEKEITIRNRKRDSQLQFYSDSEDIFCPSPLPLPNYNFSHTMKYENNFVQPPNSFIDRVPGTYSSDSMLDNEIYHVTLYKDSIYDDYGFSVSDGLYEKGVYVNRIRKGGPADIVGLLKPYDRIIQVNDTKTVDFDCCLTVPLIASAGDRIELVIARNPYLNEQQETMSKRSFSTSQNTITKVL